MVISRFDLKMCRLFNFVQCSCPSGKMATDYNDQNEYIIISNFVHHVDNNANSNVDKLILYIHDQYGSQECQVYEIVNITCCDLLKFINIYLFKINF